MPTVVQVGIGLTDEVHIASGVDIAWELQLMYDQVTPVDITGDTFTVELYDKDKSSLTSHWSYTVTDGPEGLLLLEIVLANNALVTVSNYGYWRLTRTHSGDISELWNSVYVRAGI